MHPSFPIEYITSCFLLSDRQADGVYAAASPRGSPARSFAFSWQYAYSSLCSCGYTIHSDSLYRMILRSQIHPSCVSYDLFVTIPIPFFLTTNQRTRHLPAH